MRIQPALLALLVATAPAAAADTLAFIRVPVVVNIQTDGDGPVISDADAEAALKEANRIMTQAGIRLDWRRGVPGRWNVGTPAANAGNADGNSSMTPTERDQAAAAGGQELDSQIGSGKGVKIVFCNSPNDGHPADNGIAMHYNRTVFAKPVLTPNPPMPPGAPPAPPPATMTGVAIAHELAHAMSLGAGHAVTDTVSADDHGHVPETAAQTLWQNLMFPFRAPGWGGHGTLTDQQIAEIRLRAREWGWLIQQVSIDQPALPLLWQAGGRHDPLGDGGVGLGHDIASVALYSDDADPFVRTRFCTFFREGTSGYPGGGDLWSLSFDADANPGTGAVLPWQPGVDRELQLRFFGDRLTPPLVEGVLIDHGDGGIEHPLASVEFVVENEYPGPSSEPEAFMLRVDALLPKELLAFAANQVPAVGVTLSAPEPFIAIDEIILDFHHDLWANQPVVIGNLPMVPAAAGWQQQVDVTCLGLTPSGLATVLLDDDAVAIDVEIDPIGSLVMSIDVCGAPPVRDFRYITVFDNGGKEGFTIVQVPAWYEDFDSYAPGTELHGEGGWKGWEDDPAFAPAVTNERSRSGSQSVQIEGDDNVLHEFCVVEPNTYAFTAWQYIPSDFTTIGGGENAGTWFALLNTYPPVDASDWSVQIHFDPTDGLAKFADGGCCGGISIPYDTDRWVKIQSIVDLEDDWTRIYYDDNFVAEYQWTGGVWGGGGGAPDIAVVDLYAFDASRVYYDDLRLERLPDCDDPAASDPDDDGLDSGSEMARFSDPCNPDTDGDGVLDGADNCPLDDNPDQADADDDGIGNACDDDYEPCPFDVDGSGGVDVDDLVAVILAWGTADPAADIDRSGVVDVDDLILVVLAWGNC